MNIRIADAIHAAIAVLWASLVATASGAERPANPQSIPVTTPLMAVDAKLHSAFKEYIGLRTAREGSVFHVAHGLKEAVHARGLLLLVSIPLMFACEATPQFGGSAADNEGIPCQHCGALRPSSRAAALPGWFELPMLTLSRRTPLTSPRASTSRRTVAK